MKIKGVAMVLILSTVASSLESAIPTRFGVLTVEENKVFLLNPNKVLPEIENSGSGRFTALFQIKDMDVVFLEIVGGSACPTLLRIFSVSKQKLAATDEFGSCSESYALLFVDGVLKINMRGFSGPFEGDSLSNNSARLRYSYIFSRGNISESIK